MTKRDKTGCLKGCLSRIKDSFTSRPLKDWLKFAGIDFVFFFIMVILLTAMLVHSAVFMTEFEKLSADAVPLLSRVSTNLPSDADVARAEEIRQEFNDVFYNLLFTAGLYILVLFFVLCLWSFITLAKLAGVKMNFARLGKFLVNGLSWFLLSTAALVVVIKALSGVFAALAAVSVFLLLFAGLTVMLFHTAAVEGFDRGLLSFFGNAFKKVRSVALPVLFVVMVFVVFNIFVYLIRPGISFFSAVLILFLFLFIVSWGRFYLNMEFDEAGKTGLKNG